MMRRVVVGGVGVLMALLMGPLADAVASAQGSGCSRAPCGSPSAASEVTGPVVVDGTPSGVSTPTQSSVLDRESGAVAPPTVAAAGVVAVAAALGMAVWRRRLALEAALVMPLPPMEMIQDR